METFLSDLAHSLRLFRRAPGFTMAAVAALALGIGANTAIFSVVDAVLLKPIPFPDPDRLVMLTNTGPQGEFPGASPAKFAHWRQETDVVQDVTAFRTNVVNDTSGGTPEQLRAAQVSADYFRLFGAPLIRGRGFTQDEDRPNGAHVVVISYGLWQRHFGGDPAVIGKTLALSGDPYAIVGVVGPGFDVAEFGPAPEVWTPFQLDPNTNDQGNYFTVAGRLRPGVSLAQARARIKVEAEAFRRRFPTGLAPNQSFGAQRFREAFVNNARPTLLVLVGAVAFVLLIACANVANLLLVRATARRREFAIRAALGAGRARIVRQLLTESVVLALAGAAIGTTLGVIGIRALLAINTAGLPRLGQDGSLVGIDWRVLGFTLALAVGTGLLFGLMPALQASRLDLTTALKDSAGRGGAGVRHHRARAILVVTEVALALVLLVGSALLIRTSLNLRHVRPGFDAGHVLTMRMSLSGPQFQKSMAVAQLVRDSVERLEALPGVEVASATCCIPLEGGYGLPFNIIGRPPVQGPFTGGGGWLTISPGFFQVFKIPIVRGRAFTIRDDAGAPPVVVINETMARQFWKTGDPLSDRLLIGGKGLMREFADEPVRQIVGIVGDVRDAGLNTDPGPRMYVPQGQVTDLANALNVRITPMAWVVRTRTEPYAMSGAIQNQLRQSTGLPVSDVRTMDEVISRSTSRQRFNMLLMTIFGGAALLLAAIGIYGLMAYSVQQRTPEIGVRLALGAEAGVVRRMILVQGLMLALAGIAIGLASAFGLTRVIASFLFGVKAWDPLVFVSVPLLLALVALAAVWWPAARASRVNPTIALRFE
ncbi:MAG TPA: ABC transporter permease [Vicinamibacterales bacterium]|nr:ABC transporter permease [Vicinamibacterales bacterium]